MPAGKRQSPTKADVTRARVLDAAAQVFREKGYIGAPLAEIAAVAGLQAGSLYYHFVSREAVVEEVLHVGQQRTLEFVRQRIAALPEGSSGIDRLRAAITAHGVAVLEISDYTSATIRILPQVPEDIRRRHQVAQREYAKDWTRLLEEAAEAGELRQDVDLRVIRLLMMGALNSAAEWYDPSRGLPGDELAAQFAEVLLNGLALSRQPRRRPRTPRASGATKDARSTVVVGNGGARAPDQPRRTATRARILDAAAQVFHENGYAGTRLADIASAAGLQTASLYYHFESREDLVIELIRLAWERTYEFVCRSVEQLPPGSSQLDRLAMAMSAHLVSALEKGTHTAAVIQIMGEVPEGVRRQSLVDQRKYIAYWRAILQQAAGSGEIRSDLDLSAMLMMILGALNWTADWYDLRDKLCPQDIAAELAAVVIDGLAGGRQVSPSVKRTRVAKPAKS
jgi:AcrR family transcriptional regulator